MSPALSMAAPLIIALTAIYGIVKNVDVYSAVVAGATGGLRTLFKIAPALVGVLTAVYMLRASGIVDMLTAFIAPVLQPLGIPEECAPLMLMRPLSGGGALGVGGEIIKTYGPDSLIGRTAAIMLGSTETTFYVIAVYFGAAGVSKTRYAIPCALLSDAAGFYAAALCARIFYQGG